jgi:hypothetical protein
VAELDCEGERARLAGIYLDNLNSKYNRRLTVASVVAGALTTAATALITQHNAQATVGISGGLVSAALALSTINPKGRKIEFYHERNLLRPIWDRTPVNAGYPLFVWKMLHTRAAMLSQLQSTIRSINQDLASLVVVIEML